MLQAIGNFMTERFRRWMPDAFVFAVGLTLLTTGLAYIFTDAGPVAILDGWYRGFWQLLAFGMQMVLMLSTGFAIALSPAVARLIDWIAHHVNTPNRVYIAIVIVGGLFGLVSWGWLVLTAVLARELAQRVRGLDYAFLTAVVYLSGSTWVGGLSSSIPLLLNTPGNFLIEQGTLASTVSVATTLGGRLNMAYLAMYFFVFPLLILMLRPRTVTDMSAFAREESTVSVSVAEEAHDETGAERTLSNRMNQSRILALVLAFSGFAYIARHFALRGFDIDLNIMIFIFIMTGLLAHGTPLRYVIAMRRACANVSGIIFQYPFYAGIMGIMTFTGLGQLIANAMASGASAASLPFIGQIAGAVVNFAIPSAGGEWAVIGATFVEATRALTTGLPTAEFDALLARVSMAVAYGETSTNLLQPFFLLIVLPVMGAGMRLQARDVMGYLVLPFIVLFGLTAVIVTWV